jgi:hypothetical protein
MGTARQFADVVAASSELKWLNKIDPIERLCSPKQKCNRNVGQFAGYI